MIRKIKFSIAIDGGAASGKSTASKIIAKKFNFKLLTSGELYRFVAFKMIKDKKNLSHKNYLKKIFREEILLQ